ncbi:MAG: hypothetical protein OEU54_16105 [Gemmatimonadota bacterium]|nr:hypothetical protein [Gemmatimonadota bacterium]
MGPVYMFCTIFGGAFALLSALGDFFGDADLPVDVDADFDVDGVADLSDALTVDADVGYLTSIFSVRSLIFAVLGFGATGMLLTTLGAGPEAPMTVGLATGAGLGVGIAVGAFLGYLKRSDAGPRLTEGSFKGLTGRVTLPLSEGAPGRIVVTRGHRDHTVRALPFPRETPREDEQPEDWTNVFVVEMRDGVAYVEPLDEDRADLLGPGT